MIDGMTRFTDKVAIVTGGCGGIGRAICLRLAAEGAAVVAYDLDGADAAATTAEIVKAGGKAIGIGGDILSESDIDRLVETTVESFGQSTF